MIELLRLNISTHSHFPALPKFCRPPRILTLSPLPSRSIPRSCNGYHAPPPSSSSSLPHFAPHITNAKHSKHIFRSVPQLRGDVMPVAQVPVGSQAERFAADPPRPVFGDILLAKLKPGQQIDIECRVRGVLPVMFLSFVFFGGGTTYHVTCRPYYRYSGAQGHRPRPRQVRP